MRRLIELAIHNPVAMNLLMTVTLLLGLSSLLRIPQENFPDFSIDRVAVTVPYPGATPQEIEEGLCIKVEEALDGIEGIRRIDSQAREGMAALFIQIEPGEDLGKLLDDVKQAVDRITTFPEQAEDPKVEELLIRTRVMELVLHGPSSERALKELSREIRDDLLAIKGLSQVGVVGTRQYEIAIELKEERLRAYGLTFQQVAQLISASSFNLPAGSIKTNSEEYLVRIFGQRYEGRSFEQLPVLTRPDGTTITLADVAEVRDGFEEEPIYMEVGGERAVMLLSTRRPSRTPFASPRRSRNTSKRSKPACPAG